MIITLLLLSIIPLPFLCPSHNAYFVWLDQFVMCRRGNYWAVASLVRFGLIVEGCVIDFYSWPWFISSLSRYYFWDEDCRWSGVVMILSTHVVTLNASKSICPDCVPLCSWYFITHWCSLLMLFKSMHYLWRPSPFCDPYRFSLLQIQVLLSGHLCCMCVPFSHRG